MIVKIDNAGRVVLPKPVRDRLGLRPGADLELSEQPGGLLLKPVSKNPSLVHRDGLLVHQGKLPAGYDWQCLL